MKNFITFILLIIFCQLHSQNVEWAVNDSFDNFNYGKIINRIDGDDNVYFGYSTTEVQFGSIKFNIEKYNDQGVKVSSFGLNGVVDVKTLLSLSNNNTIISFEVTDDDKLLLLIGEGSSSTYSNLFLVRLNDDGTEDVNFGVSGTKNIYTDDTKYDSHFKPSMIKANGKYFILNNYKDNSNMEFAEISCFDDSGDLDVNLFDQGNLEVNYGIDYTFSQLDEIANTGNYIYIVGIGNYVDNTFDQFVSRVDYNTGLLDTNYGTNGYILFNDKSPDLFQTDGNIIEVKAIPVSPGQRNLEITRYLSDGTIDDSYATNGVLTLSGSFLFYNNPKAYNLPNGDIFIHTRLAAFASDKDAIIYVKNSGELENSFGGNIIDNGNPILGTFGLPTFKSNPGWLSFGQDYFITSSRRVALPQSMITTKINYAFNSLSVEDNNLNSFKIYPNPASHTLTIESETIFETITIYNLEGRLLKTLVNDSGLRYQLDVSSLSKGLYFLEVKSSNSKQTHKFIKN